MIMFNVFDDILVLFKLWKSWGRWNRIS